ncbi:MAG: site-2 protease family protein [Sciscionella sp.]
MTTGSRPGTRTDTHAAGIPLGQYAGVPVSAHWSVLVILALLTQVLAVRILPSAHAGQPTVAYWLVAAGASLVFFVGLLAHELAHAVVARHYSIPVTRIRLWLLGGQTELGGDARSPRAEARIAGAGPATSLGLGGLLAGAAWLLGGSGLLATALVWLAAVNLLLGVFNLLPGAPLDGGRLLRAALWHRSGDRGRAMEGSARAGQALGTLLIALGLVQLLLGAVFGLWLALIGWFVVGAAAGERYAARGHRLRGLTAADVMTTPPATAPSWWTVADFLIHLAPGYRGQLVYPLIDFDGRPQGVLTMRDLDRVPAARREDTRLRDAARSRVRSLAVAPDTPLADVVPAIHRHGGVAVVVEADLPVGTLTEADLAAAAMLARLRQTPAPFGEPPLLSSEAAAAPARER